MAMDAQQLKDLIIVPAIKEIDLYSDAAVNLLLGTAAQESLMGTYLKQIKGIALSIYQIEPPTHTDIWQNFITPKIQGFWLKLLSSNYTRSKDERLIYDLKYATQIARLIYYRVPEALPDKDDIVGLATYWKMHWNTKLGKGTIEQFQDNYKRYVIC